MQQILTSEIGEKWIQPSLYPANCSTCKRSFKTEDGLYCFPKNKMVDGNNRCKKFEPKPEEPAAPESEPDPSPRSSPVDLSLSKKIDEPQYCQCEKPNNIWGWCFNCDRSLVESETPKSPDIECFAEMRREYEEATEGQEWEDLPNGQIQALLTHSPNTGPKTCKSCQYLFDNYCTQKSEKLKKINGCESFNPYLIHCIDVVIGDEVSYQLLGKSYQGIIAKIDQTHIYLKKDDLEIPQFFQLLAHGRYTKIVSNPELSLSKKRRERGEGSGSIVKRFLTKKIKKEVKSYEQYWYDYELWESGQCLKKGSAYIPKNKLEEIELMNRDKKPVKLILEALGKTV